MLRSQRIMLRILKNLARAVVLRVGGWALQLCDINNYNEPMFEYRIATLDDLKEVSRFTDFWLSGRGKRVKAPGAVDDCFVSPSQHRKYVCKYRTFLCLEELEIIGWAVVEPSDTLIHLLIAGNYRGQGIGRRMMDLLSPKFVRSKSNQSSGDPIGFYENLGYTKVCSVQSWSRLDIDKIKPSRKPNIDILQR